MTVSAGSLGEQEGELRENRGLSFSMPRLWLSTFQFAGNSVGMGRAFEGRQTLPLVLVIADVAEEFL